MIGTFTAPWSSGMTILMMRLSQDTFEAGIYRSDRRDRYTGHRAHRVYQILNKTRPAAQLLFADMLTQHPSNFEGSGVRLAAALRQYSWQHLKDQTPQDVA